MNKLAAPGMTSICKMPIKCLLEYDGISDVDIDNIIAHHTTMST